tara:strand:+ start:781 stop:1206 length:426 start_codon:yes stop_codon:yes gene_type:complete
MVMDTERVQRLGSLVAVGVATQLSGEFMKDGKGTSHSFWLLIGLSIAMMVLQTLYAASSILRTKIVESKELNWLPWANVLSQTLLGLESVLWTLYGNAVGQWVLGIYLDTLFDTPLFFYFLPVWMFVISYFVVATNTNLAG